MREDDWPPFPEAGAPARITPEQGLARAFEAVEEQQYDLNRRAAARAAGIADAVAYARENPWIYALPGDTDERTTAERCAVMEASCRLHLSEPVVRDLAHVADVGRAALPALWAQAREGLAPLSFVQMAVSLLPALGTDAAARTEFDARLADLSLRATPTAFRAAAKRLVSRLGTEAVAARRAAAYAERRVVFQPDDDGMSWVSMFVPTADAVAGQRRLNAAARRMTRTQRAGRTRDQIRADLLASWMRGTGTASAVKAKVFVTVPVNLLGEEARASVRRAAGGSAAPGPAVPDLTRSDLNSTPHLIGEGDIDPASAIHELLDAGKFTRVITDPVTGVILDMDRRARTVTRAQREWLILQHGHCTRDGCTRRADDADIDHWQEFFAGGTTDLANLHPFCPPDHKARHESAVEFHRRDDLTVQVRFPTGFATERLFSRHPPPDFGDDPPF